MLAEGDRFTVTPTFHVFQMYLPHSGAQAVRAEFTAPSISNALANAPIPAGGNSYRGSLDASKTLAGRSGSASVAAGNSKQITLTVVNRTLTSFDYGGCCPRGQHRQRNRHRAE
jgi:alpha-L-arabinofuranosidase